MVRITDANGIPATGCASFSYRGHTVCFDTIEGQDSPTIRVTYKDGPSARIVSVEEAILTIDRYVNFNQ